MFGITRGSFKTGIKTIRPLYGFERAFWNLHSSTWDDKLLLPEYREHIETALSWLNLYRKGKNERVLDIGCGTGNYSLELARAGFDVDGIDFAARMLGKAKIKAFKSGLSVRFSRVDFNYDLPYPVHSFDYALCAAAIQCVAEPLSFLREVKRVLVPEGLLLLIGITPWLKTEVPEGTSLLKRIFWRLKPFFKRARRIRRYTRDELAAMLDTAGFEIVKEQMSDRSAVRILARASS
jgi:ubiquinone/menaquinone biosynthesis C-methylase UbiE